MTIVARVVACAETRRQTRSMTAMRRAGDARLDDRGTCRQLRENRVSTGRSSPSAPRRARRRRVVPEHGLGRLRRRGGGDEGPQGERGAPRSKGAAPGTSSRILGRVNGGALGTRPAARPPSTTRPPAKPARPADSDPVANEEGVLTLDLLREAAGAAGAGPSDAVELDLHNRGITTLARGALGRCGATLADLDLSFNAVSVVEGLEPSSPCATSACTTTA